MEYSSWIVEINEEIIAESNVTTEEEFIETFGKMHSRPKLNVNDLNKSMAKAYSDYNNDPDNAESKMEFKKLKVFTQKEQDRRFELSKKVHDTYVKRAAKKFMINLPSTGSKLRYPEESMMIHEKGKKAEENNKKIQECFAKPEEHKEELLDLHVNLLNENIEKYEEFVKKPHTDEELVDNIELVLNAGRLTLQIENMKNYFNDRTIDTTEQQKKYDEMQSLFERYTAIDMEYNMYTKRLGVVHNPLYSVLDTKDTDALRFYKDATDMGNMFKPINDALDEDKLDSDREEIINPTKLFPDFVEHARDNHVSEIREELNAMVSLLSHYDNAKCTITIGDNGKEYSKVYDALDDVELWPGTKVTVKNDRNESLDITDFSKRYHAIKLIEAKAASYMEEELPAEVPAPKEPAPKKPGLFARIMNTVSFGLLFRKSINDYNEYKTQKENHDTYIKETERIKKMNALQKKHFEKVHPELKKAEQPTPYDTYKKAAFDTIQNPGASREDIQRAVATIVTANMMKASNKPYENDMKVFEDTVNKLAENKKFAEIIGTTEHIRETFNKQNNEKETLKIYEELKDIQKNVQNAEINQDQSLAIGTAAKSNQAERDSARGIS